MADVILETPAWARVRDLDPAGVEELRDGGAPLIDIRRDDEWDATGIIPGSHCLTFFDVYRRYDLPAWLESLVGLVRPREPFVLICRAGIRTAQLGRYLDGKGMSGVHHLAGGLVRWTTSGKSLELPD